ncbi:uncharacterized protein LOC124260876 [Haliotis rubra]|uniref:uncharacterized protein LOC124260876 n=1 Tax=Haliotis rubra TaxID=36100 RepID=UPI001EE4FAE1|nr:uncharacterized protein LOC124260876 [Haliotis rubra]
MRPVLLVWLFGIAFLPESQQLESSGISLGSLSQKPLSSVAGSLNTLSSKGSISKQSNNQPSNGPDPYIAIAEQDALSNTFGIEHIQLAYRNGNTMSKAQCMQNCSMDDSCVVAMYCNDSPVEENCANLLKCTITRREKGRLCHTYVTADNPSYLPHSYSASSCQYLSIHPNCRNQPQISNTNVDQHPTLEEGVVRYRYVCAAGYENSNKGSVFGVCDKQGNWIFPSLACRQSQSKGAPSSLISIVRKATAVGGKQGVQGPVEIQLAPPDVGGLFGDSAVAARPPQDAPAPATASNSALEQAAQHIKSQILNGV